MQISTFHRAILATIILAGLTLTPASADRTDQVASASQTDIPGPAGSESFGESVTVLPNGNIVVTDPAYDAGSTLDVGAVYLYDATGALISTLTGSTAHDRVGSGGVTVLANGNYVVCSPDWDNGGVADAGAATWANGTTGVNGAVSPTNSLVGSTASDQVGENGVTPLTNGNYVVQSPYWNNGAATDAGAVTWGNGTIGISGPISLTNSLIGSTANDRVGQASAIPLSNGNYVVRSRYWDNGGAEHANVKDAGAVTWGNGTTGTSGAISSSNSLVGSTANDEVGYEVTTLSNGHYVVQSPFWDRGGVTNAGAATWGNGTFGTSGVVSTTNSLVGSTASDQVGDGVTPLSNGHYVVSSRHWDNDGVAQVGAATWANGTTSTSGVVSTTNSLVGSTANDQVGDSVTALSNGHYVVGSPDWDNDGVENAGAVTWGNGTTGTSGTVSAEKSLVGSKDNDQVGDRVTALSNGHYVVSSPYWDNDGVTDVGAVTWGNGTVSTSGVVSTTNSLVGSTASDQVGSSVMALSNGHYVVHSPYWDAGGVADAGAVTWGDGTTGVSGTVSSSNSLVGSTASDQAESDVIPLSNGHYVVRSPFWDRGSLADAGAATWGNGISGTSGAISSSNSLVGSTANDRVGHSVTALSNGSYVVGSPDWDDGGVTDAGAVTWGNGTTGISGAVSSTNSLVGSTAGDQVGGEDEDGPIALSGGHYLVLSPLWDNSSVTNAGAASWGNGTTGVRGPITGMYSVRGAAVDGGFSMKAAYDDVNGQLVVGRSAENIVSILRPPFPRIWLPLVLNGTP